MPLTLNKIGIFGGSFDPIHNRHIDIALSAISEFKLDRVIFVPTVNPPHKGNLNASIGERIQMIKLAISSYKNLYVSDVETHRSGIIYTFDTLNILKKNYPSYEFYYIIGEDSLNYLDTWYKSSELFKLCNFIVCDRYANKSDRHDEIKKLGAKLFYLSIKADDISSTKIRESLGIRSFSDQLPIQVFEYIYEMGLYKVKQNNDKYREYIIKLQTLITDKRQAHSLAVAYTARQLAHLHKLDEEVVTIAALLHDCAKCMSLSTLQKIAQSNKLFFDNEIYTSSLLHAPIGAQLAKTVFRIDDNRIFSAITYHTIGMPGMNAIDMVVFIADKIEPTRMSYPGLEEIRLLAKADLKKAMTVCLQSTNNYLTHLGKSPHINSIRLLEWLKNNI